MNNATPSPNCGTAEGGSTAQDVPLAPAPTPAAIAAALPSPAAGPAGHRAAHRSPPRDPAHLVHADLRLNVRADRPRTPT
jgi:hypothetical protein